MVVRIPLLLSVTKTRTCTESACRGLADRGPKLPDQPAVQAITPDRFGRIADCISRKSERNHWHSSAPMLETPSAPHRAGAKTFQEPGPVTDLERYVTTPKLARGQHLWRETERPQTLRASRLAQETLAMEGGRSRHRSSQDQARRLIESAVRNPEGKVSRTGDGLESALFPRSAFLHGSPS